MKLPPDPAELFTKPSSVPPPYSDRERVVEIALHELQNGDHTGEKYWRDVGLKPPVLHWCGTFALWCLRQAELCEWDWLPRKGFLYFDENGRALRWPRLPVVPVPEPGDIAHFHVHQHYAIVTAVEDRTVYTIDGNQADRRYPVDAETNPGLRARRHRLGAVEAYFSIGGLCS